MGQRDCCLAKTYFKYLFFLKQSSTWDNYAYVFRSDCSDDIYLRNVARVRKYLNAVIDEIWWADRLSMIA